MKKILEKVRKISVNRNEWVLHHRLPNWIEWNARWKARREIETWWWWAPFCQIDLINWIRVSSALYNAFIHQIDCMFSIRSSNKEKKHRYQWLNRSECHRRLYTRNVTDTFIKINFIYYQTKNVDIIIQLHEMRKIDSTFFLLHFDWNFN